MNKGNKKIMVVALILVVTLGSVMFYRGMTISGANLQGKQPSGKTATAATVDNGIQNIETKLSGRGYPAITVTKGVPVRWNMKAEAADINGCNGTLVIPQFNIEKKLVPGDNIIEFTPTTTGSIPYSCWMGMIRSNINVVDNAGALKTPIVTESKNQNNTIIPAGGSCCVGGSTSTTTP